MSRVGKNPIAIPDGIDVTITDDHIAIKGKLGEQTISIMSVVNVSKEDNHVQVSPKGRERRCIQAWGTTAALIRNAINGVNTGFTRKLEVNGVGYRANVQGKFLKLQLGFSHDIDYPIPDDIKISIEGDRNNVISISGISKQRIGQVASEIRSFRPPEPYKGKGVKYLEETIVRKEGKKK